MSAVGVKISWYVLFSRIVSTFIACCDTSLCWARVGIRLTVTGGALVFGMGVTRAILGTPPGVFALV